MSVCVCVNVFVINYYHGFRVKRTSEMSYEETNCVK